MTKFKSRLLGCKKGKKNLDFKAFFRTILFIAVILALSSENVLAVTQGDIDCDSEGGISGTCFYDPDEVPGAPNSTQCSDDTSSSGTSTTTTTAPGTTTGDGITINNAAAKQIAEQDSTGGTNVGYALYDSTGNLLANYNDTFDTYGASITKAMILVAYLTQVDTGTLSSTASSDLKGMIEASSDTDANAVYDLLTNPSKEINEVASEAGMASFQYNDQGDSLYYLGQSQITANDFAKFFSIIDTLIPQSQLNFALGLLSNIQQQVGLLQAGLPGTVYSKEGWKPEPGGGSDPPRTAGANANPYGDEGAPWIVNQAAQFTSGSTKYGVAVTVAGASTQAAGEGIIQSVVSALVTQTPASNQTSTNTTDNSGSTSCCDDSTSSDTDTTSTTSTTITPDTVTSGGAVVNDPTTQPGQSLGGVDGTGFTQAEINTATSDASSGVTFSGGTNFDATTYGPPWTNGQGNGTTSTGINLTTSGGNPSLPRYLIAVDPSVIPYGSLVTVWPNADNWKGPFLAADTGNKITGDHVDVYDWDSGGTSNVSYANAQVEPYTDNNGGATTGTGSTTDQTGDQCCGDATTSSTQVPGDVAGVAAWSSGLSPPYIVEQFAINVLEDLAQKKGLPNSDTVTQQHVLALVAWASIEGGNINNTSLYNLYNAGQDDPGFTAGAHTTDGLGSYVSFDAGVEETAREIDDSNHTGMLAVLLDPTSSAQDFAHAESYSGTSEYPGTAEWAGAAASDPASYEASWDTVIQTVTANYAATAALEIGPPPDSLQTNTTDPSLLSTINSNISSVGGGTLDSTGCTGATSQGAAAIVQEALALAWPEPYGDQAAGSEPTRTSPLINTAAYQQELNQIWGNGTPPDDGADCGTFVSAVMHGSGADPNYPLSGTGAQWTYVTSHPNLYDVQMNVTQMSDLEPGDILIVGGPGGAGAAGHTWIYVGQQAGGWYSASASEGQRSGNLDQDQLTDPNASGEYLLARIID